MGLKTIAGLLSSDKALLVRGVVALERIASALERSSGGSGFRSAPMEAPPAPLEEPTEGAVFASTDEELAEVQRLEDAYERLHGKAAPPELDLEALRDLVGEPPALDGRSRQEG